MSCVYIISKEGDSPRQHCDQEVTKVFAISDAKKRDLFYPGYCYKHARQAEEGLERSQRFKLLYTCDPESFEYPPKLSQLTTGLDRDYVAQYRCSALEGLEHLTSNHPKTCSCILCRAYWLLEKS